MSSGSDPVVLAASAGLTCSCHWEVQPWLLQCLAPSLFQGSPCSHAPLDISTALTSHDVAPSSMTRAREKECWCLGNRLASIRLLLDSRDRGELFLQVTLTLSKILAVAKLCSRSSCGSRNSAGPCSLRRPVVVILHSNRVWAAAVTVGGCDYPSDDRQSWLLGTDTEPFHAVTTGPLST